MKGYFLLVFLLGITWTSAFSQEVTNAAMYNFSSIAVGSTIQVADPLFTEEISAPTVYKQDRKFRVELFYNRNNHTDKSNGTQWKMDVTVVSNTTSQSEVLSLEFSTSTGIYSAWADFVCPVASPTASMMNWNVSTITMYKWVTSAWQITTNTADLPMNDIHIEAMALNDRLTLMDINNSAPKMSLNSTTSQISWDYVKGAIEYDVEWVFIDDNDLTNFTYNSSIPQGPFDFKEPVRITTFKHHHSLDLIYPKGTLYLRVRPKGYFAKSTGDKEIYYTGKWSYLSKSGGNLIIPITTDFEGLKNWQYTVAYAENGLSKGSVTYFDGAYKAREQLTKMKSSGQVVAAATVYDAEGRQAVQIIPTPVVSGSLAYFNQLHTDATGGIFDKTDFDYATSNPLGTNSGAGQYYSSANTFTSDPYRERTPDAEGYAYTQTDFINDGTGRPRRTSGVGKTHRMGAGHETQFFYVKPTDRDLRELFGSNVGSATHYDKQIVVDANGQASVTYTDQLGRTIASGLYAGNPSNLLPLDNNTALGVVRTVGANLMGNNIMSTDAQGNKTSITEYFHMNIGTNPITLTYDMTSGAVNSDPLMGTGYCSTCFYKLDVWVYDPTGNVVNLAYNSQTDGLPSTLYPNITEKYAGSSINCASPTFNAGLAAITSNVNLSMTGEYRIYKVLTVDVDAVNNYLATTALTLPGAPSLSAMITAYQNNAVTIGCGFDCNSYFDQDCREQNGIPLTVSSANLIAYLTANDPTKIAPYQACLASKCAAAGALANTDINGGGNADGDMCSNYYDMMKGDVSPGGWVFEEDAAWKANTTNWDYLLFRADGTSFDPHGVFSTIESNWDNQFAQQLVVKHPEYCHYTKCVNINALKVYNQTLTNVVTYATAVSGGYINGSTWAFISTPDPLYASSIYTANIGVFNTRITNYNGYSSIAAYVEAVRNTLVVDDVTGAPLTPGTTAYNDKKWNVMKKLYLGTRDDFMEDYYTPTCAYYASSNANFIDPNATVSNDQAGGLPSAMDGLNINCTSICNSNVNHWLQQIQLYCTLSAADINTISNKLQNYCLGDCGSLTNEAGAIQLSDVSSNTYLLAVQTVLHTYGYTLRAEPGYTLIPLAIDDVCTNPSSMTFNNVTQITLTTSNNLALLQTLPSDRYTTFINNPAIVGGGYVGSFSSNHWNSTNMKVEFQDGTTSMAIINIQNISEISVIDQQIVTGTPNTLRIRTQVLLTDGTTANYWMTKFILTTSSLTGISFPVTALTVNNVVYTYCPDQASPFDIPYDLKQLETDCITDITSEATIMATQAYNAALATYINGLRIGFSNNCFGTNLVEKFTLTYPKKEYAFTLYYYDQAGNLVQTVPPQGVNIVPPSGFDANNNWNGTSEPQHTMKTIYTYNSLQQITKSNTPDGGISQMWYNAVQQVRFSQNAQQATPSGGSIQYSYTKYDALGRPVEVGLAKATAMSVVTPYANDNTYPVASVSSPNTEVVMTYYETQSLAIDAALGWKPDNLNTRIATVAYYDSYTGASVLNYNNAIFYDYDIHGNVSDMLTDSRTFDGTTICNANLRYKRIHYDFDVYSGKVNQVWYQKDQQDQFIHSYEYDDDNRITAVYTSPDGVKWDQDAKYYYYLHGPLARMELGETKVQGIDYAYTVHGWLKGVNSNTASAARDLGKDGTIVDETGLTSTQKQMRKRNRWMAQDAYGYSLTYFNNATTEVDYKSIDTYVNPWLASTESAFLPASNANLYNGNIRAMVTALKNLVNSSVGTVARVYQYDQLQRIKEAQTFTAVNIETANSWSGAASTQAHYSSYQYDLNGNITQLIRKGGNSSAYALDQLAYTYYNNDGGTPSLPKYNNRLSYVTDGAASGNYTDDLETQGANNYVYDNAGRLITDVTEQIQTITWTATNKVAYIQRTSTSTKSDVAFKYNAMGIRIAKIEYQKSSPGVINTAGIKVTFYALDAQGNTMATYSQTTLTASTAILEEFDIYGSSRLGVKSVGTTQTLVTTPNYSYIASDNRASALVELTATSYPFGQLIQFRTGTTVLNSNVTWSTTLLTNVNNLVKEINNQTVLTDVSASIWYSNNTANTYIIQLKYGQAGNWNGKSLNTYANGVVQSTSLIKRQFGFGATRGRFIVGNKRYELSNHLGNVLEVITDRKWGVDDGVYDQTTGVKTSSTQDGLVDYYTASIVSYSDYDPFGTMQDGRKGQSSQASLYNNGFQGQRTDDEIKGDGNSIDYKYRMHDPRIGRFFALDPLAPQYAHNSPYAFSENRVINAVELEGLEAKELSTGQYVPTCSEYVKKQQAHIGIVKDTKHSSTVKEMLVSDGEDAFAKIMGGVQGQGFDPSIPNSVVSRTFKTEEVQHTEEKINNVRYLVTNRSTEITTIIYGEAGTKDEGKIMSSTTIKTEYIVKQKIVKGNAQNGYILSSKNEDFINNSGGAPKVETIKFNDPIDALSKLKKDLGTNKAKLVLDDYVYNQGWTKKTTQKIISSMQKLQDKFEKLGK